MKTTLLPVIFCTLLLAACGEDKAALNEPAPANPTTTAAQSPGLPAGAPAVGTPIQDVAKDKGETPGQDSEYAELDWEDLELPGQGLADIIKQFQPQIEAIPEGDPAEDALLEELQSALNSAPVNPALDGKKIKIPGFISPLEVDEEKGTVKEFLLVPYFGACIHVPPPPLNQTLLVKPQPGKSIGMERMYEPVWVSGMMSTDYVHTDLAGAGYQINEAIVEIYGEDEEQAAVN